ncbi:MAG: hypothetical protein ACRCTP_02185 [Aeromonas popoffii]|uniref:hypothetical protein n=1 Tax=Aeromonas popoffii TaxID=70856 RepID=UPI003F320490
MKIVDLTGNNRGVVSFHVDLAADGSCVGRFEVGKTNVGIGIGENANGVPTIDELQVKFDKPESVGVFIHQLTQGYNKMAYCAVQKLARDHALAEANKANDKAAKQEALKGRIEQMAKELSALQGEYAELQD